jgi:hypothetical protein
MQCLKHLQRHIWQELVTWCRRARANDRNKMLEYEVSIIMMSLASYVCLLVFQVPLTAVLVASKHHAVTTGVCMLVYAIAWPLGSIIGFVMQGLLLVFGAVVSLDQLKQVFVKQSSDILFWLSIMSFLACVVSWMFVFAFKGAFWKLYHVAVSNTYQLRRAHVQDSINIAPVLRPPPMAVTTDWVAVVHPSNTIEVARRQSA